MTIQEWRAHEDKRQQRISGNRSRLMRGKPALPKIPSIPRPRRVQLLGLNGDYIGTWPYGVSVADAKADATSKGEIVEQVNLVF